MSTVKIEYSKNPEMYKLNFGKFKGMMLKDISDMNYLTWCTTSDKLVDPIKRHIQDYFDSINYVHETKVNGNEYVLTFGKHKGKKLSEVDKEYLQWMLKNEQIYDGVKTKIKMFFESAC